MQRPQTPTPTYHQQVNRLGRDRHSIPFFYAPRPDAQVACLPPFRGAGEKYPPVMVKDYLRAKYESIVTRRAERK